MSIRFIDKGTPGGKDGKWDVVYRKYVFKENGFSCSPKEAEANALAIAATPLAKELAMEIVELWYEQEPFNAGKLKDKALAYLTAAGIEVVDE